MTLLDQIAHPALRPDCGRQRSRARADVVTAAGGEAEGLRRVNSLGYRSRAPR